MSRICCSQYWKTCMVALAHHTSREQVSCMHACTYHQQHTSSQYGPSCLLNIIFYTRRMQNIVGRAFASCVCMWFDVACVGISCRRLISDTLKFARVAIESVHELSNSLAHRHGSFSWPTQWTMTKLWWSCVAWWVVIVATCSHTHITGIGLQRKYGKDISMGQSNRSSRHKY